MGNRYCSVLKSFSTIIVVCLLASESKAFSGEVTIITIRSLQEVLEKVVDLTKTYDARQIAFFSDWDNVISAVNGVDLPTREETSAQILASIAEKVRFSVLTSRGSGKASFRERCVETSKQMFSSLASCVVAGKNPLQINPALKDSAFEFPGPTVHLTKGYEVTFPRSPVKQPQSPTKDYPVFVASKNIAYAGNPYIQETSGHSLKGLALTVLIDQGYIQGERPSVILFVDDDWSHISGMAEAFAQRSETVFLFHFPVVLSSHPSPVKSLNSAFGLFRNWEPVSLVELFGADEPSPEAESMEPARNEPGEDRKRKEGSQSTETDESPESGYRAQKKRNSQADSDNEGDE